MTHDEIHGLAKIIRIKGGFDRVVVRCEVDGQSISISSDDVADNPADIPQKPKRKRKWT